MAEKSAVKAERNTKQQALIWQIFSTMHNHPTADMVYEAVSKCDGGIGRATVYRALHRFVEKGRAICVPVYDGADRYDETLLPHSHAKCLHCGGVSDVFIRGELPEIEDDCGFSVEGGAVLFYGCCADCRENNK